MTEQDVKEIIIPELLELYEGPYGSDNPATAAKAYIADLAEFPRPVLVRAWRNVRRDHVDKKRPAIGTIRKECLKHHVVPSGEQPTPPSMDEVFATEQGQRALAEGCGLSFLNTCRQKYSIPPLHDALRAIEATKRSRVEMANDSDPRMRQRFESFRQSYEQGEAQLQKYRRAG